jgi:hypothetical protein
MKNLTLAILSALALLLAPSLRAQEPQASASPTPIATGDNSAEEQRLQAHLDDLKDQLAVLLSTGHTELHPKVQSVQAEIAAVTQQLLTLKAEDQAQTNGPTDSTRIAILEQELADLKAHPDVASTVVTQVRIDAIQAVLDWKNAHQQATLNGLFQFGGGTPVEFLLAADQRFHLAWLGIATLPKTQESIQVPPFSVYITQPTDVLNMYNWLAANNPLLGKWEWQGDGETPNALILQAPQADASSELAKELRVKAFSLAGIPKNHWDQLVEEVYSTKRGVEDYYGNPSIIDGRAPSTVQGKILGIQPDSKILAAAGTQSFIDLVDSVVAAFKANWDVDIPPGPAPQSPAPPTSGSSQ